MADETKPKETEAKKEAASAAKAPAAGAPAASKAAATPAEVKASAAEKAAKQALKHRARNKAVKSGLKTFVHKTERLISQKDLTAAGASLESALRALDRAAKKGIIHPNNAARRKSRLMKKYNAGKVGASKN